MAEQILQIENVDPKDLYGPNDKYLDKVKSLFPKLKIIARGDFVKVIGDEEEMEAFISRYEMLTIQLERKGKIDERDIEDVMLAHSDDELQQKMSESDVLVFGRGGLPVKAITANQKRMVTASEQKDLVFAVGPAGTGKTYIAIALAVRSGGSSSPVPPWRPTSTWASYPVTSKTSSTLTSSLCTTPCAT